jgi:hypothetical protein
MRTEDPGTEKLQHTSTSTSDQGNFAMERSSGHEDGLSGHDVKLCAWRIELSRMSAKVTELNDVNCVQFQDLKLLLN